MTDLPPPGWYSDPTSPVQERWWDGERWSDQVRRKDAVTAQHRRGDLRDLSGFLNHAFGLVRTKWDDFLLVAVIAALLLAVSATALVRPALDAVEIVDSEVIGWGATQTWQIVFFVLSAIGIYTVISLAHYRLAWAAAVDEPAGWAGALQFGIAGAPRLIGWVLLGALPFVAGLLLLLLIAQISGALAAIGWFVFIGAVFWWALVVAFIPIALVAPGIDANPIRRAWSVVRGRWWRIFGRVLLIQFITGLLFQVIGALVAQVVGGTLFGLTLVDAGDGRFDVVKNLGSPVDFFITSAVFLLVSVAANVGQIVGVTSIAHDVMETGQTGNVDSVL